MDILFVCLGNICRSPAAEAAMIDLLVREGLEGKVSVDSAGTSAYHAGEPADSRMREHGARRGLNLASKSRQFTSDDFTDFDYIVVMDESNYRNVLQLDVKKRYLDKIIKMAELCPSHEETEVPDPYYGGEAGFENVFDMVGEGCKNLLDKIKKEL